MSQNIKDGPLLPLTHVVGHDADGYGGRMTVEPWRARQRVLNRAYDARIANPHDLPEMDPADVTLTADASADATLTRIYTASSVNLDALPIRFRGGFAGYNSGAVVSSLYNNSTSGYGQQAWSVETTLDGIKLQFDFQVFSGSFEMRFLVDEGDGWQYVSKSFTSLPSAEHYRYTLAFPDRKVRRIRAGSTGALRFSNVRCAADSSLWRPDDQNGIIVFGDSFTQGTGAAHGQWASWAAILGKLLGSDSTWLNGLGGCGYLTTGGSLPQTMRQSLPILTKAKWDLVIFAAGLNDSAQTPSAITAECVATYQAVRTYTDAPIIVFGPWSGSTGPSAAILGVEDAIAAAVASCGVENISFIPTARNVPKAPIFGTGKVGATDGTGNSDVHTSSDGTHPDDSGHDLLARWGARRIVAALEMM